MLTNISVSKQIWRGWPESIADELSLAQIGIPKRHKLSVKPKDNSMNVSKVAYIISRITHLMYHGINEWFFYVILFKFTRDKNWDLINWIKNWD